MDTNRVKKLGAAVSAGFFILYFALLLFLYLAVGAPLLMVIAVGLIFLGLGVILIYHVIQRFKEIEEGLDDAVDNY